MIEALEWQFARTSEQVNQDRERLIKRIEDEGESMWNNGSELVIADDSAWMCLPLVFQAYVMIGFMAGIDM